MKRTRTSPRLIARQAGYRIRIMRITDADAVARLERTIFAEGWSADVYRNAAAGGGVSTYWVTGTKQQDTGILRNLVRRRRGPRGDHRCDPRRQAERVGRAAFPSGDCATHSTAANPR